MVVLVLASLGDPCRRWLRRLLPAFIVLFGALPHAKADPRIDQNTAATSAPAPAADAAAGSTPPDGIIEERGLASWYGQHWRGRRTASGTRFDDRRLTAASLSLPLATRARVT